MNKTMRLGGKLGIALCGALLGALTEYTTCGQPSVSVGISVPLPAVEIRAESDFYAPLTPYGRWEVVGAYGRCWIPGRVEADWRPYSEGYWQSTDDGWYWVSDEPWAWATYHYGRWDLSPQFGWYWVPQIQWAPAWVSWHSGGGYVGWAPLYPSGVRVISPRAYVFVEERHFMDPVRRSTVIVNSTTIINKTVVNKGPTTAVIEKASGRKIQRIPVQELRHQTGASVAKQRAPTSTGEKNVPAHASPPVEKTSAAAHESPAPAPKNHETPGETRHSVPTATEGKPAAKPEGNHPPAIKESSNQNAHQPPARPEKPDGNEPNGPGPANQDHGNKGRE